MAHLSSSPLLLLLAIVLLSFVPAIGVPRTAFQLHKSPATKSVQTAKHTYNTPKPSPISPRRTASPSVKPHTARMEDQLSQSHPCFNREGALLAPEDPECLHLHSREDPHSTPSADAPLTDPYYRSPNYHYNDDHSRPGNPRDGHPYDDYHHNYYHGDTSYSSGYGGPYDGSPHYAYDRDYHHDYSDTGSHDYDSHDDYHSPYDGYSSGHGGPYHGNPYYAYDHDYHYYNPGHGGHDGHYAHANSYHPHDDYHNGAILDQADHPYPTPFAEPFKSDPYYHPHDYQTYDHSPGNGKHDNHYPDDDYHNGPHHNQPHYPYPMPSPDHFYNDPHHAHHYDQYHHHEQAACGDDFYSVELINATNGRLDAALQARFGQHSICRTELHSFKSAALTVPAFCARSFSRFGNVCVRDMRACYRFKRRLTAVNILKFETPCIRDLECDYGTEVFEGKCYEKCPHGFYRKDTGARSRCVKPVYFRPLCDDKDIVGEKCLEYSASGMHGYHHGM